MGLALFGMVDRREQLATPLGSERAYDGGADDHAGGGVGVSVVSVAAVRLPDPSEVELEEARVRSARSGLEMVDLRHLEIDPTAADALPVSIARRHRAAAIGRRFGLPLIAIAAPENLLAIDDVYLAAGTDVLLVVAPERQVEACVEALYPPSERARSLEPAPVDVDQPAGVALPADDHVPLAEAHYGADDVDWYRIGAYVGDGVRSDPVLPSLGPFEEPPFTPVDDVADGVGGGAQAVTEAGVGASPWDQARDEASGIDRAELEGELFGPPVEAAEATEPVEAAATGLETDLDASPWGAAAAHDEAEDGPVVPWWMREMAAPGAEVEAGPDEGVDTAPEPAVRLEDALGALAGTGGEGYLPQAAEPEPEPEPEPPAPAAPDPGWHHRDVGDVLLAQGLLAEEQLATARQNSRTTGRPLRAVLAELQLVEETDLLRAVAEEAGRRVIDLDQWPIDPRAGALLPESVARRYGVLAVGFEDGRPVVATADPSDVVALDDVRTLLGGNIVIVVCAAQQIEVYLGRVYRRTEETDLAARSAALVVSGPETSQLADLEDLHALADEAPVVRFVNLVLRQALNEAASDVHIEPTASDLVVRCRIDGVLHHLTRAPRAIQGSVTSRLKVMAGLDIAEHRIPQDGRFSLGAGNRQVDLRLATLPTVHGEKIVLRILDKSTAPLQLERLGFLPGVLERYQTAYRRPAGTILVTGPTGSGKSTTLYATLAELNSPERNLITVEDPVEYQMAGVNQVQVNPKAGLTFASALRSILRSDPDIILVGEIRDKETATIAVEAALTGHLVLSCLHTNDAVSTPMRLIEMGVEPFLVGSAIDCILAQRLARILCQRCAQPYEPNAEELRAAGWKDDMLGTGEAPAFRRAQGCQACSGTGYRGRIAVQEVLLVDEDIERAILDRATSDEIARLASAQGMTTLRRDGLHKAALGITSLEEIMRVVV